MSNSGLINRGFAGTLKNVQLTDILQMSCIGGTSTAILVGKNGLEGIVYLIEGEIVHAEVGDIVGETAFYTIMGWNEGNFEFLMGKMPNKTTITLNWQHLIMEACRRQDENALSQADGEEAVIETSRGEEGDDKRIRVLVVDDSAMMRKALASIFDKEGFLVVGSAANGAEALELIPGTRPDVITMDVNMPVMDGISALKRIMIRFPLPVVMVSAMTQEGAALTFDTLKYGAVDFIPKPSQLDGENREKQNSLIREKVQLAAKVAISSVRYIRTGVIERQGHQTAAQLKFGACMVAGEGGYGALLKIIPHLTPDLPVAFMVVLYAAPEHVDAFTQYLDSHSQIRVLRATDNMTLQGGVCYLVAGVEYATIEPSGDTLSLRLTPSSFPNRRGAGDMLLISMAERLGKNSLGIILSGAFTDGADGVKELVYVGGETLIQSPETCLMREMPKAAMDKCADALVVADNKIGPEIIKVVQARSRLGSTDEPG
ncbi:MAG: hypothetical protein CSA20_07095 [Deltaproteobacteria bacterium]|nr:MAG: hypothetical protein CSA20_07095 [Deltaproteobacteria bacterium]